MVRVAPACRGDDVMLSDRRGALGRRWPALPLHMAAR